MRFLEREVYAFAGSRRNAVGPHFFVYGRAAGNDVGQAMDRPRMGRGWYARELAGRATRKERRVRAVRGKGRTDVFLFLGKRSEGCLLCPPGGSRGRSAAIVALGIGTAAKTSRAGCGSGWSAGGNPACGGLWPPFQLIQLIYLRYLCGSVKREERMDVCFLLTLYI